MAAARLWWQRGGGGSETERRSLAAVRRRRQRQQRWRQHDCATLAAAWRRRGGSGSGGDGSGGGGSAAMRHIAWWRCGGSGSVTLTDSQFQNCESVNTISWHCRADVALLPIPPCLDIVKYYRPCKFLVHLLVEILEIVMAVLSHSFEFVKALSLFVLGTRT